jgi:hypothetical protein
MQDATTEQQIHGKWQMASIKLKQEVFRKVISTTSEIS